MTSLVARGNLLLSPNSTGRHPAADTSDWTGIWVGVGFAEELSEVGSVLPATIGYHATHVRRTQDGLVAAINAKPFGGCMSIPVHCGSTRNVRCPHLSCAFSEDGGVLDSQNDFGGVVRAQFVGDGRRTATLPLAQRGSLLFVNVTTVRPPPLSTDLPSLDDSTVVASGQQLVAGNWLDSPPRAARTVAMVLQDAGHPAVTNTTIAPNVALSSCGTDIFVALSRPAGHTRSVLVWALLSPAGAGPAVDPQIINGLRF